MAWRVAESLDKLRDQIDAAWPNRNKASDGTIGDAAHCSGDPRSSDHCPWVKDGAMGVVTALDITHDPTHGVDNNKIVANLVASRDPRIKYIIWNGRIISSTVSPWVWRTYTGSNPHTKHFHLSVSSLKSRYDSRAEWRIRTVTKQMRWELWAARPEAKKLDHSIWVKDTPTNRRTRLIGFRTRTALRFLELTLKGRRPHFRTRTRQV